MLARTLPSLALWATCLLLVAGAPAHADGVVLDPNLPSYAPTSGVSGSIKSIGSDTMNNLMTLWSETFKAAYPGVTTEVEGKGSGTALPALVEGSATFGPLSRPPKGKELDDFSKRFGYPCLVLRTSIDMLAVYVHKDNPIVARGLSLQEVDAIFSKNRRGGRAQALTTWGELGLTGVWKDRPITLYGRNSASGTYGYFKDHALFGGDFKDSVKEQPGSSSVVTSVANDVGGIGYSGIGYMTADVRAVPLSTEGGKPPVPALSEHAYDGTYPLARFLYLAINHAPGTQLDPLRAEFLRLIFSRQGQEVVAKDGYIPVPAAVARTELRKVGLERKPGQP